MKASYLSSSKSYIAVFNENRGLFKPHIYIEALILFKINSIGYFIKRFTLIPFLFIFSISVYGQATISVCSWNLKNFGKSKTDQEIEFIANTVKSFDIIAIQEVVAGHGGVQAVARLHDVLNRTGNKWEYAISEPTLSSPYTSERYAFLWKASKLKNIGEAWLDKEYDQLIEREPYFIRFNSNGKAFTLINFHAMPKSKQPETEIKYFKFFPESYPKDNLLFCGDFNIPSSHTVFNPLKKMGYIPSLQGVKTSLTQKCINGDCLASEETTRNNTLTRTLLKRCSLRHHSLIKV